MSYDHTDDLLKVGNLQFFDTKWDETIIAMMKASRSRNLGESALQAARKAEQLRQMVALYSHDAVQKAEQGVMTS